MREQSTQDPTTRLPSRSALLEHLEEAIRDADRNDRPLALITPRLDELQEINDSLGPDNGDVILRQVAARAHNTVRQDDVVARLDVNEFGVLLHCLGFQVVATAWRTSKRGSCCRNWEPIWRKARISAVS